MKEYAFEMAASSIRFGNGVTREVGMDFKNMGAQRVCVVTDPTVDKLNAMNQVREALTKEGINFKVFNGTRVEPKDSSSVLHLICLLPSSQDLICLTILLGSEKPSTGPSPMSQTPSSLSEVARSSIRPS
jgi:hypothetical protein